LLGLFRRGPDIVDNCRHFSKIVGGALAPENTIKGTYQPPSSSSSSSSSASQTEQAKLFSEQHYAAMQTMANGIRRRVLEYTIAGACHDDPCAHVLSARVLCCLCLLVLTICVCVRIAGMSVPAQANVSTKRSPGTLSLPVFVRLCSQWWLLESSMFSR
jgi:hypothetical protein